MKKENRTRIIHGGKVVDVTYDIKGDEVFIYDMAGKEIDLTTLQDLLLLLNQDYTNYVYDGEQVIVYNEENKEIDRIDVADLIATLPDPK